LINNSDEPPMIKRRGASPQRTYPVKPLRGVNGTTKRPGSNDAKRSATCPFARIIAVGPVFAVDKSGLAVSKLRSWAKAKYCC
jgi:hypothetical protein